MALRSITIRAESYDENGDIDEVKVVYRGTTVTGTPFVTEETGVSVSGLAAAITSSINTHLSTWGINDDEGA